jgi:hypothetical protein
MKNLMTFEKYCEVCQGPCDTKKLNSKSENEPGRELDEEGKDAADQKLSNKIYKEAPTKLSTEYSGPEGKKSSKLKGDSTIYGGKAELTDKSKSAPDQKIANKVYKQDL